MKNEEIRGGNLILGLLKELYVLEMYIEWSSTSDGETIDKLLFQELIFLSYNCLFWM